MKVNRLPSIRIKIIIFFLFASGLITFFRLIDIQLVRGERYRTMADANRTFTQLQPRERGLILDRYGLPLVVNQPLYYQSVNPELLYTDRELIDRSTALQAMASESAVVTMDIRRQYLLGQAGSHVMGYAGLVTADDLKSDSDLLTTDLVGKQGLEQLFDTLLRGRPGKDIYEINALGQRQKLLNTVAGTAGNPVQTTLDPYLNQVAFQAMGEKTGVVIIEDVGSGELLAMVSTPGFDPNLLTQRYGDEQVEQQRQAQVQASFSHPKQLYFNRAISGAYPPGSVFKLVTAAAGLSRGALTPQTTVFDEGSIQVGDYSYSNWYFSQYGRVEGQISLQKAIARSNDIFFYKAAEWIGPDTLAAVAREFGFGKKTGVELTSETAGLIPDPTWKEETLGERWFLGNTYHFGIGQGEVLVTPLQVAQMTQAIANRGSLCPPHLIKNQRSECSGLSIQDDDLEIIVSGMIDACSSGGTAFPLFPWNTAHKTENSAGYSAIEAGEIACKTGTSEFGVTDQLGYKKTHGWLTMFVGLDGEVAAAAALEATQSAVITATDSAMLTSEQKYFDHQQWLKLSKDHLPREIVIAVLVESDEQQPYREGSRDAAPVAKAILDWMVLGIIPEKVEARMPVPSDALAE